MAMVTINMRMEEGLKKEMETLCQELGLTMTTAVTIFAKKMVREQAIPFWVSTGVPYSPTRTPKEEQKVIIWTDPVPDDEGEE